MSLLKHRITATTPSKRFMKGDLSGRTREGGGETVEFAITLLLFFIVFFLIVDFAIAVYDKGTLVNAARVGARQGTLYWVDPDPAVYVTGPGEAQNVRIKESMISSGVDAWINGLIINPGNNDPQVSIEVNGAAFNPGDILPGPGGAEVRVDLDYPHSYIGLTGLLGVGGMTLRSSAGALVEPDS